MDDQSLFDKIEAYLLNELPEKETEAFKQQIDADPDLALEVELHRLESDAMEVLVAENYKKKMTDWEAELPPEKNAVDSTKIPRWYWTVGTIFIVVTIAAYLSGVFSFSPEKPGQEPQDETGSTSPVKPAEESSIEASSDQSLDQTEEFIPDTPPVREPPEPKESEPGKESPGIINLEKPQEKKEVPIANNEPEEKFDSELVAVAEELNDLSDEELFNPDYSRNSKSDPDGSGKAYRSYDEIIAALTDTITEDPNLLMTLGHAQLKSKQFAQAAATYKSIIDSENRLEAEEVLYYYLLSLVAQGKHKDADFQEVVKTVLKDPGHASHDKIRDYLVPKLEELKE